MEVILVFAGCIILFGIGVVVGRITTKWKEVACYYAKLAGELAAEAQEYKDRFGTLCMEEEPWEESSYLQ